MEDKPLEVIDKETNLTTPTPYTIPLHNAKAIRREMASVYRDMRTERIEPQAGTRLCYVLDRIRKALETDFLEARLEALERIIELRNSQ
jgi:hypothetical protein